MERERTANQTHLDEDTHKKTKKSGREGRLKRKQRETWRLHGSRPGLIPSGPSLAVIIQLSGLEHQAWPQRAWIRPITVSNQSHRVSFPVLAIFIASGHSLRFVFFFDPSDYLPIKWEKHFFSNMLFTLWPVFKHLHNLLEGIRMSTFKRALNLELMCFSPFSACQ